MRSRISKFISPAILSLTAIALAGCSKDEPTAPRVGVSTDIVGIGDCVTNANVTVCRLPTLSGEGGGRAEDISDDEWIVGKSEAIDGTTRPLRSTLWKPDGTLINMGRDGDLEDGYFSSLSGVSNSGWVAGGTFDGGKSTVARWSIGSGFEFLDLASVQGFARAFAINDHGEVAGYIYEAGVKALKWRIDGGISTAGASTLAFDINNETASGQPRGRMVGQARDAANNRQAAIFPPGTDPALVGPIAGDVESNANAMNEVIPVQLVGWSEDASYRRRAMRVDGGVARELIGLGGDYSEATDINDAGYAVGFSAPSGSSPVHAVLWTPGGQVIDLGGLGGPEHNSRALAINNDGTIVGFTEIADEEEYPTLWRVQLDEPPAFADQDGDGIADDVDLEPETPSTEFSDVALGGTTTGNIQDAGEQILEITDEPSPGGVRITTDPSVGSEADFADIRICGGAAALTLDAGDIGVATCTSAKVQVEAGPIDVTFTGDDGTTATASIPAANTVTFDPATLTLSAGNDNPDDITVTVDGEEYTLSPGGALSLDMEAPVIDMAIDPDQLWPPNHKLVKVAEGIAASDNVGVVDFTVTVESDEPVNGTGDGDTEPDWEVVLNSDGTYDVWVRAERAGNGDGRVYTIIATATDAAGNQGQSSGTVTVPHSKDGKKK
jgi:probable HAF family extracellular repeat protein